MARARGPSDETPGKKRPATSRSRKAPAKKKAAPKKEVALSTRAKISAAHTKFWADLTPEERADLVAKSGRPQTVEKPTEPLRDAKTIPISERVEIAKQIGIKRAVSKPPSWLALEREFRIDRQTLQRIYEKHLELAKGYATDLSGRLVVDEILERWALTSEAHYEEAATAEKPSERTAARRAAVDCDMKRLELMAATARLPRSYRAIDETRKLVLTMRELGNMLNPEQKKRFAEILAELEPIAGGDLPVIEGTGTVRREIGASAA
jgi:hypothetical protein